jgi:hypothetical protein
MLFNRLLAVMLAFTLTLAMSLPALPALSAATHAAAAVPTDEASPPCPHRNEPATAVHDPAARDDVGKAFAAALCQQHCTPAVVPAGATVRSCSAVPLPRPVRQPPLAGTAIDIDTPPPRFAS